VEANWLITVLKKYLVRGLDWIHFGSAQSPEARFCDRHYKDSGSLNGSNSFTLCIY